MSAEVRERVSRIERAPARARRRRLGLSGAEMLAAAASLLFFAIAVGYYFSSLRPEQQQLRKLEQQLKDQENVILKSKTDPQAGSGSRQDALKAAFESLETFRHEHLKPESQGVVDVFNQINALVKKNNLRLTSGITMEREPTETKDDNSKKDEGGKKGEASKKAVKKKSSDEAAGVFPMAQCGFTVFGSYQSIRSLISDLEHSKQFIVMSSMALKSGEETEAQERGRRSRTEAGAGLSLSVTLSAYFQPGG